MSFKDDFLENNAHTTSGSPQDLVGPKDIEKAMRGGHSGILLDRKKSGQKTKTVTLKERVNITSVGTVPIKKQMIGKDYQFVLDGKTIFITPEDIPFLFNDNVSDFSPLLSTGRKAITV